MSYIEQMAICATEEGAILHLATQWKLAKGWKRFDKMVWC